MNYNLLFTKAKEAGIEDIELYIVDNKKTTISLFKTEVDKFQIASTNVLSVRGIYNGKVSTIYTENLNDDQIDYIIKGIKENASAIDSEDKQVIYPGDDEYKELNLYNDSALKVSVAEKIETLRDIEVKTNAVSDKFENTSPMYTEVYNKVTLKNSKGLDLQKEDCYFYYYVSSYAKDKEERASGSNFIVDRDYSVVDVDKIVDKLASETLSKLGASPVETGTYSTILDRDAATDLLTTMVGSFSADQVQKGASKLKGKLSEKIFGENITIVDDPFRADGFGSSSFDDEGVATKYKEIVKDGVLKSYLHNLKTAMKDNTVSTGNGFKTSAKSGISISPTNFYIVPGERKTEDILSDFTGMYIKELAGTHAGTNAISGDFSLQASGFLYENGKVVKPVNLITVSGNIYELLNNVAEIASDLKFEGNSVASPSLRFDEILISGK